MVVMSQSAVAEDMFPPPWRGSPETTYQQWYFDSPGSPAFPEVVANPYGPVSLNFLLGSWNPIWMTRTGIWVDVALVAGTIPNSPVPNPQKDVWVQVTYALAPGIYEAPTIEVLTGTFVEEIDVVVEPGFPEWHVVVSKWQLIPNPTQEDVVIYWPGTGDVGAVDEVIIDTYCWFGGPTTGACCFPDGWCEETLQQDCFENWLGPGTDCYPNPCPQWGACCFPDGSCMEMYDHECTGVWQGTWSTCFPNPCPQPWCLGDSDCSGGSPDFLDILYFVEALVGEATWLDYHRTHGQMYDPPPCPYLINDMNGSGVEFTDIQNFVNALGQPCIPM
jgi:hypothetical protein